MEQQYIDLLNACLDRQNLLKEEARNNMPKTMSVFGPQHMYDLRNGYPLIGTKRIDIKNVAYELLWFLRGESNIKFLVDRGCNIWSKDAYRFYIECMKYMEEPDYDLCVEDVHSSSIRLLTYEEFITAIKETKDEFDLPKLSVNRSYSYVLGSCGYTYGVKWRGWKGDTIVKMTNGRFDLNHETVDQIRNLLVSLHEHPYSRRHMLTALDPAHADVTAVYWCHPFSQYNVEKIPIGVLADKLLNANYVWSLLLEYEKKAVIEHDVSAIYTICESYGIPTNYIDCKVYQRSADVFLGLPYNIASYSMLLIIFGDILGYEPRYFIHTIGDAHLYENHIEQAKIQIQRTIPNVPILNINTEFWYDNEMSVADKIDRFLDIILYEDFVKCFVEEDLQLLNYNPHPPIKGELSVGL